MAGTGAVAVKNQVKIDAALRAFLCATALVAVIVMVTSKQNTLIVVSPVMTISVPAKFTHSASFTYFVTALSVTCLYSIITGISSYSALKKQGRSSTDQQIQFVIYDSLMLGIVASATGAGGGVAYEALKGNPHIRWNKICHIYDIFCRHLGFAMSVSLLSSMTLLVLVWLSVCVLAKNSGRR
ncbi:CASP-like protein 1D1 [Cynara cardunculus var. scolymus]|uniref:CASP-like protein 1D1 n=1 Tax=Cynara cardunculus var. scolymus TaxID=59895 RepID=UPI000D62880A|nr:CASP-like protein 1D1 [Cynara cardunculus var. scolymus]